MPRIQGDVYEWFEACARGDLIQLPAACRLCARRQFTSWVPPRGYPENPEKGKPIQGLRLCQRTAVGRIFLRGRRAKTVRASERGRPRFGRARYGRQILRQRAQAGLCAARRKSASRACTFGATSRKAGRAGDDPRSRYLPPAGAAILTRSWARFATESFGAEVVALVSDRLMHRRSRKLVPAGAVRRDSCAVALKGSWR